MNLTQRELTSIIASAVQAALAAQQPKAAPVARKAAPKTRKVATRPAKPAVSAKATRNAATGTTRSERKQAHDAWVAAIGCGCKPFADIKTEARWVAEGYDVLEPLPVTAKTGAVLYCRHGVEAA